MKRFVFLFSALALLSGCTQSGTAPKTPDLDKSFSAEADIRYANTDCTVQMKRIDRGKWEFCVTSPFALEGMVISINNGVTKLSMYDMSSASDISSDAVSVAKLLSDAYEAALTCTCAEAADNNTVRLSGQAESSVYTLLADSGGTPLSLSLDADSVKAEFTKYVMLERPDAVLD